MHRWIDSPAALSELAGTLAQSSHVGLDTEFMQVGKRVKFSGAFRLNTLAPQFPDPFFPMDLLYQLDAVDVQVQN